MENTSVADDMLNTNTTAAPPSGGDINTIKIALQSVILYFALFGNIFVLVVLRLRKQKLGRMQWFIVHLCLTDIFVAIFNTMTQLINDITIYHIGNDFTCRFVKYFQLVAMYASSYVLIMTAVDRYVSICHPLVSQTMTPNRGHLMVLTAWIISLVFSIPQLLIFRYLHEWGTWDCSSSQGLIENWQYQAYTTWIFVSIYAVPFSILAFCYGRICHVVWESAYAKTTHNPSRRSRGSKGPMWRISFKKDESNSVANNRLSNEEDLLKRNSVNPLSHKKSLSKSKIKTIKVTLTVVICYLVCWAPYFIAMMWWAYDVNAPSSAWAFRIVALLASLNSTTNPWIYLAYSGNMCSKRDKKRRVSRSWTASTHLTSMYDSDTRSRSARSSNYDISQRSSRDLSSYSVARDAMSTC